MNGIAVQLNNFLEEYYAELQGMDESVVSPKPAPDKWSKKELMGHLIDSAQNNLRRFIVAQYEMQPEIRYQQDAWVALNHYQQWNWKELIHLWFLTNKQIAHVLQNTAPENLQRLCQTENVHTLEWLATDYIKHLQHHLHQVLNLDPIPYP